MSFSKWSYLLPPKKDELVSSWLTRNAYFIQVSVYKFSKYTFDHGRIWYQDLDRRLPEKTVHTISMSSGVSVSDIESLFIHPGFKGKLTSNKGDWPFINALSPYHTKRRRHALVYCPFCLQSEPYYRRNWRFGYQIYCPQHNTEMLDECTICHAAVIPHRVKGHDLLNCHCCNNSLTSAKGVSESGYNEILMDLQSRLNKSDPRMWRVQGDDGAFISLCRYLIGFALDIRLYDKLPVTSPYILETADPVQATVPFERSRLLARKYQLLLCAYLLRNFPEGFKRFCSKFNVHNTYFLAHTPPAALSEFVTCLPSRTPRSQKASKRSKTSCIFARRMNKNQRAHQIWSKLQ